VKSDTFEDMLLAFTTAGVAAGSGMAVTLFFTNRAARRMRDGGLAELAEVPADAIGEELRDGAEALGMGDLEALMRRARSLGDVRYFVCARGARIWDLTPETLYPEVDSFVATASFLLNDLAHADIVLTI